MTYPEFIADLANADSPKTLPLLQCEAGRTMLLAMRAGMSLKEHQSALPARLLLIRGRIRYREGDRIQEWQAPAEQPIVAGVQHAVDCLEDCICLVIKNRHHENGH